MKIKILILVLLLFLISGCSDQPDPKDEQIKQLEQQLQKSTEDASQWRTYTAIAGMLCITIFVVGIGLGSSVRKSSNRQAGERHDE